VTGLNKLSSVLLALSAIAATGCQSSDNEVPADAIACVGSSCLTRGELSRHVPGGLPPADSAAYAKAYIRNWIDARLIATVAAREIDMDEIDRLTAEYRTELIMSQYRRTMATQATDGIFSEDSLRAYYDRHPDEFTLERPLVRGIYLKVPSDAPNLGTLRRLYTSSKSEDMDRLEKEAPAAAIHYDYFRDRWVDWEQIETRIPADIPWPTSFLRSRRPLDVTNNGFTYLLSISEFIPEGDTMPFEAALPLVRERLLTRARHYYDARLRQALYEQSLAEGSLKFPGGNPLN